MTALQTRIREFLAAVKDPASLTTTRDNLDRAVALLREVVDDAQA